MHTPQITRIIRRSNQGATRPFICHADDGNTYYAKGKSASTGERIREWMGGNLAKTFGLNVPPMALLEAPKLLIDSSNDEVRSDLGAGYAVGSRQILSTSELRHEEITLIPISVQRQIVLFDYWVRNEDRTLSSFGGNPNLLWNKANRKLYAIDYNLILQRGFDDEAFWATHAFSQTARLHELTPADWKQYQECFHKALRSWSEYWRDLPEEWLDENSSTTAFDDQAVLQQLQDDANGKIWSKIKP